jgi:branched-chain amino acid aminotransferase
VIVWVNGELADASEARVSPLDHGLLVGDGVFETLRVYRGIPFAWRRHLTRLARSASGLGLPAPDPVALRAGADAVLRANELKEARLRITLTGGEAPLGSERGDSGPTAIVAASAFGNWPAAVAVATSPWPRNERGATVGLKTISYADNVRALAYAHQQGGDEAIFVNTQGELCEATGSNVFVVRGGVVRTPPESAGCLLGVTRALVLELCEAYGIRAHEVALPGSALTEVDEAFLTSTTREVQAISTVDGRAMPGETPGPVTASLAAAFADLVARDLDP